jgi:hypothetical protein
MAKKDDAALSIGNQSVVDPLMADKGVSHYLNKVGDPGDARIACAF